MSMRWILAILVITLLKDAYASEQYEVRFKSDIDYLGPGRTEKLDLYMPITDDKTKRFPGIVIVHGGGWTGGDKAAGREKNIGTNLTRAGYVCVSINYVLATKAKDTWPDAIHDCKRAVQSLRKNADKYQLDPDRIGAIGGSAGGHLVSMLGVLGPEVGLEPEQPYPGVSSRVQAVVDLYGITNLVTRQHVQKDGTLTGKPIRTRYGFLGVTYDEDPNLWKRASPVNHVTKDDPPVLILHGTMDTTVDYEQSIEFDKKLAEIGVGHELRLIPGIGHTFHLQAWGKRPLPYDLRPVVIGFFDKHLKRDTAATKPTG
ncbi:MAG: alpha/beta hydrolase [Phycisphaerae bacterium]|nr:alpha/beta hydrolase [Phycisphaerae bacterium]